MATLNLRIYLINPEIIHAVLFIAIFTAACSVLFHFSSSALASGTSSKGRPSSARILAVNDDEEKPHENGKVVAELGFECMGEIEPLKTLNWESEKPLRIYKFADKYNLTMGLRKTTINTITHMDQQYVERIRQRREILVQYPGALGCVDSGAGMVAELYVFLITHYLPRRYPTMFKIDKLTSTLHNLVLREKLPLQPPEDPIAALRIIALSVDEDFLMLLPSPDGDGYSLQAFVWMYPVGFDPADKLGIKLRDAHRPVPSYKERLETSMDRHFARLVPGRVVDRVNWAVATNSSLCERGEYHLYSDDQASTQAEVDLADTWVRCELQTLFGLPQSGGRILSVHLYLYPIQEIKDVGLSEEMYRAIDGYGQGNAAGFARYKRIPVWGEKVKEFLRT
ncbi:Fc.00g055180.m01.CDS01 [Cosmosporella sp. VM-42]